MSTNNFEDELKLLYEKHGRGLLNVLRSKQYLDLVLKLEAMTSHLNVCKPSVGQRVQWILSGKSNILDKCLTCGNDILKLMPLGDFSNFSFCSAKCAARSQLTKDKRKLTCISKYGSLYAASSLIVKQKRAKTNTVRYGVENVFLSDEVKEKAMKSKFQQYGDAHYNNSEKRKTTCLKRYGTECAFGSEDIKKKIVETRIKKYGTEHHMKVQVIADSVSLKSRSTVLSKSYQLMTEDEFSLPLFSEAEFIRDFSEDAQFEFECKQCHKKFKSCCYNRRVHRCPDCWPLGSHSYMEDDVLDFLKQHWNGKIVHGKGSRKTVPPYELDMYIPDKKLAIEFDGLYWHSDEQGKCKSYHLDKTTACESIGILLIHIFEDEWLCKPDIVKSRLLNLIGQFQHTVFARSCEVREVKVSESNEFLDRCHILGKLGSSVRLGLYYNNKLVSLMTFGKCRFDKKHEWELLRFCNELGHHVPGAASRLLKHFESVYKPKSIVSYADRRWSQGKLYEALGFKFMHASAPNYWYFKDLTLRESRVKFQKHKLKRLLQKFDPNLTELENMKSNGYKLIYDCGNLVYAKEYA